MKRVLVVEHDKSTARGLGRLLVSRGVQRVLYADSVAEALTLLEPPPDWVILDMQLPDGSGQTVLQTIRNRGLPTRVVVSSSSADDRLLAAFAAHEPDFIMPKPLDPDLLPIGLDPPIDRLCEHLVGMKTGSGHEIRLDKSPGQSSTLYLYWGEHGVPDAYLRKGIALITRKRHSYEVGWFRGAERQPYRMGLYATQAELFDVLDDVIAGH